MTKAEPKRRRRNRPARQMVRTPAEIERRAAPAPVDWRKIAVLAVGIVVVCVCVLAAHWPALSARAFCSDDLEYLVDNQLVKNPSWNSAGRFLSEVLMPSTVGGYYQPLAMISLMLDYAAGGREADSRAFHRTSLALHVANTALIVVLMYLLFGNPLIAAVVGLVFGLHPMTVEPIPWISERKTLLAALFALLCMVFYVRFAATRSWKFYAASLAVFVLALMSKPTSTPLPVCLLLLDYWPLRRLKWRAVWEKVPFFAMAGVSALITFQSQRSTFGVEMPSSTGPLRIVMVLCHNIVFYLHKMVWPADLSPHYPFPEPMGLSHPMVLAGVVGTVVLLAVLIVSFRRTPALLVGWLFFFVAIFPTMGVVGFTVVIASDKFAYLPSVGLLMLLAALLAWMWDRPRPSRKVFARAAIIVAGLVVAAGEAVAVRSTVAHWLDTDTLNQHMLTLAPESAWVHNCTAVNLIRTRRAGQAIEHLTTALELKPDYHEAHNSIAVAYGITGRTDLAIAHLEKALQIKPSYTAARRNLVKFKAKLATERPSPANPAR